MAARAGGKRRPWPIIIGAAVIAHIALITTLIYIGDDTYKPTAAETPMFAHLRQATPEEAQNAERAIHFVQHTTGQPTTLDTYVATKDFRTVHTTHPMAIMMSPGVKWLGGPLGQVVLVMRVTDAQVKSQQPKATDEFKTKVKNFAMAKVVYDPVCRALNLGAATQEACKATPQERAATTPAAQTPLRQMPETEVKRFNQEAPVVASLNTGGVEWVATNSQQVTLAAQTTPSATVLQPGHRLHGGSLGRRLLVLPRTYSHHYSAAQFGEARIVLGDVVAANCNSSTGIRDYLDADVIRLYAAFCN